jgi:PTS system arbutin-like IIC component
MTSFVGYITFNYFISAILNFWGPNFGVNFTQNIGGVSGLTMIAGIKTLDTSIVGAIVASLIGVSIHNKFFEKNFPMFWGFSREVHLLRQFLSLPCYL